MVLLGTSGCGKTTTLKMVNRLVEASEGTVAVGGVDVSERDPAELRRSIGYVFQRIGLFPHLTVAANVAVVPTLLGWPSAEISARVDELLELVGLPPAEYRDRWPRALSGGQQQRVGVARALAARQRVLLMDEPFGALDPITRDRLQGELRSLHDALGLTTVVVTHDVAEALRLGDRVGVMDGGRLVQLGPPAELLARPASPFVEAVMSTPRTQADRIRALLGDADA